MFKRTALGALAAGLFPVMALAAPAPRVTFPTDWTRTADGDLQIATRPAAGDTVRNVNCNSQTVPLTALAQSTQAQLNAYAAQDWAAKDWADLAGLDPAKVTLVETHVRSVDGFNLRIGRMVVSQGALANSDTDVAVVMGFYLLPGKLLLVGCYATPSDYEVVKDVLNATVNSLKPN